MAAQGRGLATLLEVNGHDPYRVYSEEPQCGGWRELRNPIGQERYWSHVGLRLTTWSLVELLRFNGLEEFLLLGEWGAFVAIPEDAKTYEDVTWGLPLYDNDRLDGLPVDFLKRGNVFVTLGFCRPGVVECLLPDDAAVVIRRFAPFKLAGRRLVQRLPVREHNDDLQGMAAITVPMFRVRPDREVAPEKTSALVVTSSRDPRSSVIGHVKAGTLVGLACIVGTRVQLARIPDGPRELWGGWMSFLLLDGTPTLERVLEDTENMKLAGPHGRGGSHAKCGHCQWRRSGFHSCACPAWHGGSRGARAKTSGEESKCARRSSHSQQDAAGRGHGSTADGDRRLAAGD